MKIISINPNQIISMNDYPPLHSPASLKKYHNIFKKNNLDLVTPIPVIPVSVALPYLQKQDDRFEAYGKHLAKFLKKHPNAEYFMFDGTHRATGAMLSANKIPAYLIKSDEDIKQLFSLRVAGKISVTGLKNNLAETMGVIEEHYHRTKTFWTLEEKVKSMISKGDIDKEMLEHYNNRKKLE